MPRPLAILTIILSVTIFGNSQSLESIEDELLRHVDKLEKASNYGGTSDYDVLSKENRSLRTALLKYGNRSDVLRYSFPRLDEKIFITTSKDGNLRSYSWDRQTGGTMHDYHTVYQYRGNSGKVYSQGEPYSDDVSDYGVGAFVHDIFQANTAPGPTYLIVTTFIGSTSLAGQTITAAKIDCEKLDRKFKVFRTTSAIRNSISFQYDFFSVVDHPERPIKLFFFDGAKKSFRFPVIIEDEKTPQGRVTKKYITYKFTGKYFVKIS